MDNISDPSIRFDQEGVCNYYHDYFILIPDVVEDSMLAKKELNKILGTIRENGKRKKYDCVIGLSGGLDSTFLALKAKEWGLRPLAVHFDNGWDSELAVNNIANVISRLEIDLHTHVFDWQQFRDIQLAHIKANVVDIEGIADVAIHSVLLTLATRYKLTHILSGYNYVTEAIHPPAWVFKDYYNIRDIHRRYGKVKIKGFPYFSNYRDRLMSKVIGIRYHQLLDYIPYNKKEVKEIVKRKLDWKDYGGKHCESVFTRFYQGYILPKKFGIDKRKAHLSSLICSGQITREEALEELAKPIYNEQLVNEDKNFVLKKLGYSLSSFEEYIMQPGNNHDLFDTYDKFASRNRVLHLIKKYIKSSSR